VPRGRRAHGCQRRSAFRGAGKGSHDRDQLTPRSRHPPETDPEHPLLERGRRPLGRRVARNKTVRSTRQQIRFRCTTMSTMPPANAQGIMPRATPIIPLTSPPTLRQTNFLIPIAHAPVLRGRTGTCGYPPADTDPFRPFTAGPPSPARGRGRLCSTASRTGRSSGYGQPSREAGGQGRGLSETVEEPDDAGGGSARACARLQERGLEGPGSQQVIQPALWKTP
jgi:hypothetical protein